MSATNTVRPDIQALRGLAITLVLFNHAKLGAFEGGYLGVDIFFVVSGYLITRLLAKQIRAGTFSFSDFYVRRAKRLLPAAYATFAACMVVAPFILSSSEMRDFAKQVVGAITFTANMVLLFQTDYFDGSAEFKPLLHIWSLSIEEQYYVYLPLFLLIVKPRHWLRGTLLITLASFAACLVMAHYKPVAAFYLAPTRIWELGIGSAGALAYVGAQARTALRPLLWPAILILLLVPILIPAGLGHPGWPAFLVCIATCAVILIDSDAFNQTRILKAFAAIGNISYSLYLVHWPIFSFVNNAYIGKPPLELRLAALVASVIVAYALYHGIEQPMRSAKFRISRRTIFTGLGASVTLMALPFYFMSASWAGKDYTHDLRPVEGFGARCPGDGDFQSRNECRSSATPGILVWGDSFAQHLVPGILATSTVGVEQATRPFCGPFLDLAPIAGGRFNRNWAQGCIEHNKAVFNHVQQSKSIDVVVLSSPFTQYFGEYEGRRLLLADGNGQFTESPPVVATAVAAMARTVEQLQQAGKRVVIVAPPPTAAFHIGNCLERKAKHQIRLGPDKDCGIPVQEYHERQKLMLEFLQMLESKPNVALIRFDDVLCQSTTTCTTESDGVFLYRDSGHFSYAGSELVAKKMGLGRMLLSNAK